MLILQFPTVHRVTPAMNISMVLVLMVCTPLVVLKLLSFGTLILTKTTLHFGLQRLVTMVLLLMGSILIRRSPLVVHRWTNWYSLLCILRRLLMIVTPSTL